MIRGDLCRIELHLDFHLFRDLRRPGWHFTSVSLRTRGLAPFQSNSDQAVRVCPGATRNLDSERKQLLPCWRWIIVREIINHFLDSDRILWGQHAFVDELSHDCERGRSRCRSLEFRVDRPGFRGELSNAAACRRNFVLTKLVAAEKRQP